jgi:signal transduction histidine kinase
VHSALFVPLLARGSGIGVVIAHDKAGPSPSFTDDDLRLAEALAARAAVAVDLSERVSRDAVRRVVEAQEIERARLARELHDQTGQALTSILLGLRPLEETAATEDDRSAVASLRELVVSTLQDVRRLAVELRPSALDDFGLATAVEAQLGKARLPPDVETTLYRIIQEALTNIVKHAEAKHISILLTQRDGLAVAVVEDDGSGFDAGAARGDGLGLVGMRERVGLVGGRLRLESAPGTGTTVRAEVPLR